MRPTGWRWPVLSLLLVLLPFQAAGPPRPRAAWTRIVSFLTCALTALAASWMTATRTLSNEITHCLTLTRLFRRYTIVNSWLLDRSLREAVLPSKTVTRMAIDQLWWPRKYTSTNGTIWCWGGGPSGISCRWIRINTCASCRTADPSGNARVYTVARPQPPTCCSNGRPRPLFRTFRYRTLPYLINPKRANNGAGPRQRFRNVYPPRLATVSLGRDGNGPVRGISSSPTRLTRPRMGGNTLRVSRTFGPVPCIVPEAKPWTPRVKRRCPLGATSRRLRPQARRGNVCACVVENGYGTAGYVPAAARCRLVRPPVRSTTRFST
uniref:Secreted RxLR effector protein 71 n=1 Tax=Plasmopara viticola TaxID=143451 RepID=RLR71_PLAVT|nr:RecName: Full=Secreted RxLR effector protein 71; Flags: Precursor [Plasmopara viticola]